MDQPDILFIIADDYRYHDLSSMGSNYDEDIELTGPQTRLCCPGVFRRVAVWDSENEQVIELITNQRTRTANTIGELYKTRCQMEIFFRDTCIL